MIEMADQKNRSGRYAEEKDLIFNHIRNLNSLVTEGLQGAEGEQDVALYLSKVRMGIRTLESMMAPILEEDDQYEKEEDDSHISSYQGVAAQSVSKEINRLMERYENLFQVLNRQTLWDLPMIMEPDPDSGQGVLE